MESVIGSLNRSVTGFITSLTNGEMRSDALSSVFVRTFVLEHYQHSFLMVRDVVMKPYMKYKMATLTSILRAGVTPSYVNHQTVI